MNRFTWTLLALLLVAGAQGTHGQASGQAEKLLAAADQKATIDGDLKGAIDAYKKAVAAAGANRALAARALLEMADAYRKLGDAQARQIFERVAREAGLPASLARSVMVPSSSFSPNPPDSYPELIGYQA